jgi:D-alanyl-lipoteichoic acid acyltransferase DltB (MBOAT superfamily)
VGSDDLSGSFRGPAADVDPWGLRVLFHSIDFLIFFAVVVTQYFRAPALIRWALAAVGVVFPLVAHGVSPEPVAAAAFTATCLGAVIALRRRGREETARKVLLTTASLLFYSAWRWPYASLLLFSTVLDYHCARAIHRSVTHGRRVLFLTLSMVGNLGVLGVFKYTNFLLENVESLLGVTGLQLEVGPLPIILPLGISFYTFQTMSYTIDVFRGRLKPRGSLLDVALFVSFFPQLVAGPIMRAKHFMPQLDRNHTWDPTRAKSGVLLMIWGMAKKLLIADALAPIVEQAYAQPELFSGWALVVATYCFAFQIYCDFSGYSDLAIGAARVLGFDVPLNFNRPYFATNITTFWRRWHISLSSWLRDYLYISVGGNRLGRSRTLVNLMLTMLLGGLWHGASWNFVIWGAIHGGMLTLHKLWLWRVGREKVADTRRVVPWVLLTTINFHLVCVTWVFFRAETLDHAMAVLLRILQWSPGLMVPHLFPALLIPALLIIQAVQARTNISDRLLRFPRLSRLTIYLGVLLMVALIVSSTPVDFIYFVF